MPPSHYFTGLALTLLIVTGAFFVARQFNRTAAGAEAANGETMLAKVRNHP